jgi:bifunctional DNase/RNase
MPSDLVPVTLSKIMQSRSYTAIILGDETKQFAIYTEPYVGQNIQIFLTQEERPRPSTFDLLFTILKGLDVNILRIVIHDVEESTFFARLFLEMKQKEHTTIAEVDARPSDCITLAVMDNIPIYCRKETWDKVTPVED